MLPFLLCCFLAVINYVVISFYNNASKLPRGPTAFPFVGNFMNELHPPKFCLDLHRLSKKFGAIFTFHMPFPVVNLSDYETLKEALKRDEFALRNHNIVLDSLVQAENGGLTLSNGDNWRAQRRTTFKILRDFGMGKNLMEEKVAGSARDCLEYINNQKDLNRIDLHWPIQLFVANIINDILFGFRHSYDKSEVLVNYIEGLDRANEDSSKSKLLLAVMQFPALRHVWPFKQAFLRQKNDIYIAQKYLVDEVDKVKAVYKEGDEISCYVHAYVDAARTNPYLNYDQLLCCCTDLFIAGQETTTTTLRWAMLYLAEHQDVQEKMLEEISTVAGNSMQPSLADRPRMPYTIATIHEIQRHANIIALNYILLHQTTADTTINGIDIPKGAIINADYHTVHACDEVFIEPKRFWPGRYLKEDGVTFRKEVVERTIPFGIGKRECVGQGLARVELFIGLTSIVQEFKILPPVDGSGVDLEPLYHSILQPKPHKLQLIPRQQ